MNSSEEDEETRNSRLGGDSNFLHPYKKTSNMNKSSLYQEFDEDNQDSTRGDISMMESQMQQLISSKKYDKDSFNESMKHLQTVMQNQEKELDQLKLQVKS